MSYPCIRLRFISISHKQYKSNKFPTKELQLIREYDKMRPIKKEKETECILEIYEQQNCGVLSPIMHPYCGSSCTPPIWKESFALTFITHMKLSIFLKGIMVRKMRNLMRK